MCVREILDSKSLNHMAVFKCNYVVLMSRSKMKPVKWDIKINNGYKVTVSPLFLIRSDLESPSFSFCNS